jgi:antitoxin (DNA-binding transcriptional repressor) of toxin-antitoxin stability system
MAAKSDIHKTPQRRTQRVSATWASRNFSKMLDKVAKGERFEVVRHGKVITVLFNPGAAKHEQALVRGRKASEILALMGEGASLVPDPDFGKDVLEGINTAITEDPPSWD